MCLDDWMLLLDLIWVHSNTGEFLKNATTFNQLRGVETLKRMTVTSRRDTSPFCLGILYPPKAVHSLFQNLQKPTVLLLEMWYLFILWDLNSNKIFLRFKGQANLKMAQLIAICYLNNIHFHIKKINNLIRLYCTCQSFKRLEPSVEL